MRPWNDGTDPHESVDQLQAHRKRLYDRLGVPPGDASGAALQGA